MGAKGGNLDDFIPEVEVGKAEAPTHQTAVTEELLYAGRNGISDDIEILWLPAQEEIPDASTHQPGGVAVIPQAVEDLERVGT